MNFRVLIIVFASLFLLPGCLIVSKISYRISLKEDLSGSAVVTFFDIRSDAVGNKEFDEDKKNLFDYIYKSDDFIQSLKLEGKFVQKRDLKIETGKLIGSAVYEFNDVEKIEGIRKDGKYLYLTLQSDDEVLSTNGEIVGQNEFKRIIWTQGVKELSFDIASGQSQQRTKDLKPFLNKTQ